MLVKKVNNLGLSDPAEFEFYAGKPAFLGDDKELAVIVAGGTGLTGTVLPVAAGERVTISEIINPMYSLFKSGAKGAVYRIAGETECFINVTYDGIYLLKDFEEEYYPFIDDYDGLGEICMSYSVDPDDLYAAMECAE